MKDTSWVNTEFKDLELGDKRLNGRLIKIADHLMSSTESPINQACGLWSETKAAYRFFQNDKVNYKDIIKHHSLATKERFDSREIVLAIQDTSYFNYTAHPKTKGLGILSRFTGKYKKDIITSGLYMHTTIGIDTNGLPLGLLDQKISSREVLPKEKVELKKRTHNIALPIEEKESIRWLDSMRESVSLFDNQDKKVVTIADREADIYDLYLLAEKLDTHYLIRASHNRKINKSAIHSEISGEKLWDYMAKQEPVGKIKINVPATKSQKKRIAKCSIRIGKINMLPSKHFKGIKSQNMNLAVNTIQVVEDKPPKGVEKLDWILYTNLPINDVEDALEKISWYCLRWRIEIYFKVIKSGFKVEKCRLETAERLIRYLAVISILAWRVYWLTLVSRTSPNYLATEALADDEWKILYANFNPTSKLPNEPPSLIIVTQWIAQLGGFLSRKGDDSPGITHMWRGLKKLSDMLTGARLYGQICG